MSIIPVVIGTGLLADSFLRDHKHKTAERVAAVACFTMLGLSLAINSSRVQAISKAESFVNLYPRQLERIDYDSGHFYIFWASGGQKVTHVPTLEAPWGSDAWKAARRALTSWQSGDELRMIPSSDHYILRNLTRNSEIPVLPTDYSSFGNVEISCPTHRVTQIEVDGDRYLLTLSDGSKWRLDSLELGPNKYTIKELEWIDIDKSDCIEANRYRLLLTLPRGSRALSPLSVIAELVS